LDNRRRESQCSRCKSFDTFTPLEPFVETQVDRGNPTIQLFQDGQWRQNSDASQLIFKPADLAGFISSNATLLLGDVILTGTSSGIGAIQRGD
jgi:2-keto-4-pentenoate hydratase/2-oxohepta-3-ene-1,7-dioic acid hydratase in catechol pathway